MVRSGSNAPGQKRSRRNRFRDSRLRADDGAIANFNMIDDACLP